MEWDTGFPGEGMFKRLWVKFLLLLLAVSLIALSAALLLRELMVRDFRGYIEGEMEDRVYWVTASLESNYQNFSGWNWQSIVEDTVWALMLGFDVKLYDANGALVVDTQSAIDSLSPLVKKRVLAILESRTGRESGQYVPYPLFLGGNEIGMLRVKFLRPKKESIFIERSNRLLLISLLALGGIAIVLSIIFSKRLTNPIEGLTEAAVAIGEGNLKRRVAIAGQDEISKLSGAFNRMAQSLELQEALRKKLTSNVAHELRTPISAIRGELEGMIDGFIPADSEHLQSLYAEIGRLRKILEGIEELSQAEASGLTLRKQELLLQPFLKNILERFMKVFQDSGVGIELACDEGLKISADPDRLSQVVINLLSNALKATEKGGNVRVMAARGEGETVLEVRDNGRGIKSEDLPYIFERFYRGTGGGLGLGLTIVRELVEAHGGRVTVSSEYGKGATFTVSLP
jgi:two-component system sensor histidine kinase BaeS